MAQQEKPEPAAGPVRELSKEEKAELRTGTAMRNLISTEGWKVYAQILQMHLQGKRNEFEEPCEARLDGISQVLRSESAKGAIMGLRLALSIPESILSNDRILRKNLGLASSGDEE